MSLKNVKLKCQCANCSQFIAEKNLLVTIESFPVPKHTQDTIKEMFPKVVCCPKCGSPRIDFSYRVFFEHKYETETMTPLEKSIDRCKAQIAATYDHNNNIPLKDREIIRVGYQSQLKSLLQKRQSVPTDKGKVPLWKAIKEIEVVNPELISTHN
ncbi:hypothetical protein HCG49_16920 [Arenibacter sp. 6A1]|uniref:hypothetical protein n=1 Tax=Arenibacter sp. 6A1 TaxID=2720391 RepID=UPI0014455AE1|nr:hypothetical protein [Arenibacter sp. 6A1]NKI28238.1 hypothetical protein [Arenibacter sp. 6A1]